MDNKKIVNLDLFVKSKDVKIFFGEYNGFQRFDIYKHNFAKIIEKLMRQAF
ncbi:MAG: hypothetical protein RRY16_02025 [Bacilli bacterium]